MQAGTAFVLGESDGHHLEHAALVLALEVRVGLDLVVDDDAVRLRGDSITVDGRACAVVQFADPHDVHAGTDRRADVVLNDAIAAQDLQIARDRATAVAAHGRNNKGRRAPVPKLPADGAHDLGVVGNAAAAHRHGDALAAHEAGVIPPRKLSIEMRGYVLDPVRRIELPHARHARQRHFLQPLNREADFRKIDHFHGNLLLPAAAE